MKTRKPLIEMIPELLNHFQNNADRLETNYRIYNVLQGQLRSEVEASLAREILSPQAYKRCVERIPSINMVKKVTDKLSKVYTEKPTRIADENGSDVEIMGSIIRTAEIDAVMCEANRLYNAVHSFALEPYVQDNKHKIRVLTPHQFLPYSDSLVNPNEVTVFMKFLGRREKRVGSDFDSNGTKKRSNVREMVEVIALYSDDEFMIIDSTGNMRDDIMLEMGINTTINELGRIPFVYKSRSSLQLLPYPNKEGLDMAILIPKLLTDLNYSSQFMSHSIIWTINTDIRGAELNPDSVVNLGNSDQDGNTPEIGTVDPKVDIAMNLSLIKFQTTEYLDGLGIKSKGGTLNSNNPESGIAKSIDESDVTAEKKVQTEFFRCVEVALWNLLVDIQRVWSANNLVEENRVFTEKFRDSFRIQYAEMRAAKTQRQKLEEIQLMRQERLMTRRQAIRELKPDFTEKQIDTWLSELEKEDDQLAEQALMGLDGLGPAGSGRNSSGQFTDGNTEAKDDPDIVIKREEDKLK